MKSPPTSTSSLSSSSSPSSEVACSPPPPTDCAVMQKKKKKKKTTETTISGAKTETEAMQETLLFFVIALSALQHASLFLSMRDLSATDASPLRRYSLFFPKTSIASYVWLSPPWALLTASTAVSLCLLAFLLHTRRVWPTLLAFALHVDLLALTLALHYGIASEFFFGLVWVSVLFFLLGEATWGVLSVTCFMAQGFLIHFALPPAYPTFELTSGAKLVCCGFGLLAVGGAALILHRATKRPHAEVAPSTRSSAEAELLAHLGREIKAPLLGILSLATQVVDSLSDRLWIERECVQRIIDSGHVILCLMDNVLDFPTISSAQVLLQSTPFSVVDEFNHVVSILKPAAFKKQITIESIIDVRYPHRFGDAKRFRQILFNVLSNAIKFTHEKGSIKLSLQNARVQRNRIEVRVDDTGVGIARQHLPYVFDLLHVDEALRKQITGTGAGLGLAICRHLCEEMNGRIYCESKQGIGSSFIFYVDIPVFEQAKQRSVRSKSAESLSGNMAARINQQQKSDLFSDALGSKVSTRAKARRHSTQDISTHKRRTHSKKDKSKKEQPQAVQQGVSQVSIDNDENQRTGGTVKDTFSETERLLESADEYFKNGGSAIDASSSKNKETDANNDSLSEVSRRLMDSSDTLPTSSVVSKTKAWVDECAILRRRNSEASLINPEHPRKNKKLQPELQGLKVLVVEDNRVNQKVAKLMLSSLGCKVEVADNGKVGFEMVTDPTHKYDMILMDLQMPIMDGFISATKIRDHEKAYGLQRTPIVSLTASTTSEYRDRCYACGMDDWLSKPFSKEQLTSVLLLWTNKKPTSGTVSSAPPSIPSSPRSGEECSPAQPTSPPSPPSDDNALCTESNLNQAHESSSCDASPDSSEATGELQSKDMPAPPRMPRHSSQECQHFSGEYHRHDDRPSFNRSSSA